MPTLSPRRLLSLAVAASLASPALGVSTQFFKAGSKAELETGKLENVVVTNFGELKLARAIEDVYKDDASIGAIEAMAQRGDVVYVATSASGKLLALKDGKVSVVLDLGDEVAAQSLLSSKHGSLFIGTGGEKATLLEVLDPTAKDVKPREIALPEGVQYVWAIAESADSSKLYLATGPTGTLLEVDAKSGATRELFKCKQNNLLSMAISPDGKTIYVGTDPDGLVYRVDVASGASFVMYDANETEIGALALDAAGHLYVGTSQTVDIPEVPDEAVAQEPGVAVGGRPVSGGINDTIPGVTPEPPRPLDPMAAAEPRQPDPAPTDPAPAEPGEPKVEPKENDAKPQHSVAGPTQVAATSAEHAAAGNAVYRIDPSGFVSEVFRDAQSMVFDLAIQDGKLLIATGGRGKLMQFDPATEETVTLAQTKRTFLTSILATSKGELLIGTSDEASIAKLTSGLAKTGTLTSEVLDAGQIAQFGNLHINGTLPAGTKVTIATRSGNLKDPAEGGWSDWTAEADIARYLPVTSPAARFVQYRLTLAGDAASAVSPTIDDLSMAYQLPNLAPRIDSITIAGGEVAEGASGPNPTHKVDWTATDPNGDDLKFVISMRAGGADSPWVPIAKDVTGATWEWDTRRVADGRYELKIEASDAGANAPGTGKTAQRISDPHLVDNTAPAIGDVQVKREKGKATVDIRVVDRTGIVASLEYAVDGVQDWQKVLPSTTLNDSPEERYTITLDDPGQSARVVSLRAKDDSGNVGYQSVTLRPDAK
jgi:sugar lactone lactonase YvrE